MEQVTENGTLHGEVRVNEAGSQETMESMMEQYDIMGLRKGEVRSGTVVDEMENGWLVDVGYKCEGYLPAKEWTHRILVGDAAKP